MAEGYTYLDRFLDEMKNMNNGEIVFVATSIGDYKSDDFQYAGNQRYIKQLGEVVVYYREVTLPNGEKGVRVKSENPINEFRPAEGEVIPAFSIPLLRGKDKSS